mgnify:CR=1 FL=1
MAHAFRKRRYYVYTGGIGKYCTGIRQMKEIFHKQNEAIYSGCMIIYTLYIARMVNKNDRYRKTATRCAEFE